MAHPATLQGVVPILTTLEAKFFATGAHDLSCHDCFRLRKETVIESQIRIRSTKIQSGLLILTYYFGERCVHNWTVSFVFLNLPDVNLDLP